MLKRRPEIDTLFRELVRDHGDQIYNMAMMRSNNAALSQDICQETYIRAFKGISKFRDESQLSTWLYRIALNVCHSTLGQESRRNQPVIDYDEGNMDAGLSFPSAEDVSLESFEGDEIRQAIGQLPVKQAEAITLYYLREFRYTEVSEIMDIPINTVKSHLRRAKLNLKTILYEKSQI